MRSKQMCGAFLVIGGEVCAGAGADHILVLFEAADGLRDLLRIDELADGWYVFNPADAVTRGPVKSAPVPNVQPHKHSSPTALRRARIKPTIRARRRMLSLYGQVG